MKKWKLLKTKDVSPSSYFPIEKRTYQRPDGVIINDFFVDRLADPVHVLAVTRQKKIVMIKMYKQGTDELMIQFPAGRFETKKHTNYKQVAVFELEEEAGIRVLPDQLTFVGKVAEGSTKSTATAYAYFAKDVEFNSKQKLDDNEEIEVLLFTPAEIDQMITDGKIWDATAISIWQLAKLKEII